jgi:hypothetical protein
MRGDGSGSRNDAPRSFSNSGNLARQQAAAPVQRTVQSKIRAGNAAGPEHFRPWRVCDGPSARREGRMQPGFLQPIPGFAVYPARDVQQETSMSNQNQNPGQQNQKPGQQQGGGQKPGQQQQDPNRQGQNPGQQGKGGR